MRILVRIDMLAPFMAICAILGEKDSVDQRLWIYTERFNIFLKKYYSPLSFKLFALKV